MKAIDELDQLIMAAADVPTVAAYVAPHILPLASKAIPLDEREREIKEREKQLAADRESLAEDRRRFSICVNGLRAFFIGRHVGDRVRTANAPVNDMADETPPDFTH